MRLYTNRFERKFLTKKKCQFQIFSVAVAITSVVLAYALRDHAQGFALLAPIVMNTLALAIIADKAISIQRKVGYVQVMEEGIPLNNSGNFPSVTPWKWESHLEKYRGSGDVKRNHSYLSLIGTMLLVLNLFCLGFLGIILSEGNLFGVLTEILSLLEPNKKNFTSAFAVLTFLFGLGFFLIKLCSLIHGKNNSTKIKEKWIEIINESKKTI